MHATSYIYQYRISNFSKKAENRVPLFITSRLSLNRWCIDEKKTGKERKSTHQHGSVRENLRIRLANIHELSYT
jgi:hypothetical protein